MNVTPYTEAEKALARRMGFTADVLRPYCVALSSLFQHLLNEGSKSSTSTLRLRVTLMPEVRVELEPEIGSRLWRRNDASFEVLRLPVGEVASFLKTYLESIQEIRSDVAVAMWVGLAAALPVAPTVLENLVIEHPTIDGYAVLFRTGAARSL